jgi:hypothetical protein
MSYDQDAASAKETQKQINILRSKRKKHLKEALMLAQQIRILRFSGGTTVGQILLQIRRRKDREWVMSMLRSQMEGKSLDDSLEDATRVTYPALRNRSAIMDQALSKLHQPDICQALESAFAAKGFAIDDAIELHIGHIKGTHKREVVTKSGATVSVPIPPSYAALQGYYKMVVPAQTAKVQIEHTNVNDMLRTIDAEDAATAHRIVGEVIDVMPAENPDDVDPFEDEDLEDDEDDEADEAEEEDEE